MYRRTKPRFSRQHHWVLALALILWSAGPAAAQQGGREPRLGADRGQGGWTYIDIDNAITSSGTLRLWRAYAHGGARVILKVYRNEGNRLVLVGSSALEMVPPAEVATFSCTIPVSNGDYLGCYCPDVNCVDRFADGTTLSINADIGTTLLDVPEVGVETGSPTIYATGSANYNVPSPSAESLVVPVVGRTPGYEGTRWVTTFELLNPSAEGVIATLFFNQSGRDNTIPAASATLLVQPRSTVVVDDLLFDSFALEEATGALALVASAPVIAHARIANVGSPQGTFGQLVPALPTSWALRYDDTPPAAFEANIAFLFEVREDEEWRTNLGVVNVAHTTLRVEVTARNSSGSVGSPLALNLQRQSHQQVNRILDRLGVPDGTADVYLRVVADENSSGRFFTYASRIDNRTGDSVFLLGVREPSLPELPRYSLSSNASHVP